MRLFEAIIEANHRAVSGDASAGVRMKDFADSLPVVALTCIDARLNPLLPEVLAIPEEHFIWLRNAGNIVTSTTSSTLRSLALACAIKGGREIAIIGHTDCRVGQTSMMNLIEQFKRLGIERFHLPDNLTEFFGIFASEQQNVLKAVDLVRRSPLIGPAIPVHGLIVDIKTGRLTWLVNGYEVLDVAARSQAALEDQARTLPEPIKPSENKLGDTTMLQTPIGQSGPGNWTPRGEVTTPPTTQPEITAYKGEPPPIPKAPPLTIRRRPGGDSRSG